MWLIYNYFYSIVCWTLNIYFLIMVNFQNSTHLNFLLKNKKNFRYTVVVHRPSYQSETFESQYILADWTGQQGRLNRSLLQMQWNKSFISFFIPRTCAMTLTHSINKYPKSIKIATHFTFRQLTNHLITS